MEIPRYWRLQKTRYTLAGQSCPRCDTKYFPSRGVCPNCGAGKALDERIIPVTADKSNEKKNK